MRDDGEPVQPEETSYRVDLLAVEDISRQSAVTLDEVLTILRRIEGAGPGTYPPVADGVRRLYNENLREGQELLVRLTRRLNDITDSEEVAVLNLADVELENARRVEGIGMSHG